MTVGVRVPKNQRKLAWRRGDQALSLSRKRLVMALHRAKEEVDAMQDTIQQNARQVKEALGIDLKELVI